MGGQHALQHFTIAYKLHFAVDLFHAQHFTHATTDIFHRLCSECGLPLCVCDQSKNAAVCEKVEILNCVIWTR